MESERRIYVTHRNGTVAGLVNVGECLVDDYVTLQEWSDYLNAWWAYQDASAKIIRSVKREES